GKGAAIPAQVPGCVHLDLLAAGRIEDPFYRDHEHRVQWVGERDWVYRRSFTVPASLAACDPVRLRCEGLDTLAEIRLNGRLLARTDNMFRTWEIEVGDRLKRGRNTVEIRFASALEYARHRDRERLLPAWGVGSHKLTGGGWIRKEPCNFGWDWGPMLVTCGIWRRIELVGYRTARIADLAIRQDHGTRGQVGLDVDLEVEHLARGRGLRARVRVELDGREAAATEVPVRGRRARARLTVRRPRLWWPLGLGDQPLYRVTAELVHGDEAVDAAARRIGLRTLALEREDDRWGQSFRFACNGVAFFAKGANWIPADPFAARVTDGDYERLLGDAAAVHMNMLRVWGGGIYEQDAFYDRCDELGICVWQDFMFACATYPAFDAAFRASVRAEAEDNVRRLRHHPSIALWCGNNELEQGLVADRWTDRAMSWSDYGKLFDRLLPEVVGRLDPDRPYWPCSPHSPVGDRADFNNPACGDAHLWSVWHGRQPFEWYRTCQHRFNSEFGFQSFPEPRTVASYTVPEDRNITSYVMEHHQRSGIGNSTIVDYLLSWFRLPTAFDMTLWLSQILQGMAIKYAVEHWRRAMPRGMGTLYWQINDCWPVASWSSIDSLGRWKALHYMARRFYAPVLISGLEDAARGTVEIHVTSDLRQRRRGVVRWRLTDAAGRLLRHGSAPCAVAPRRNQQVARLDLAAEVARRGARDLLLWLELEVDGEVVSTNFVSFARPKHLELEDPGLRTTVRARQDGAFEVTLRARRPALWAWLELADADARYSDGFVHLAPGAAAAIEVRPAEPMDAATFKSRLRARSLWDTYQAGGA
ncbi:MAG: glycoside hydrolase family 2 protein, partial [Gemmatimonadota bacterium]